MHLSAVFPVGSSEWARLQDGGKGGRYIGVWGGLAVLGWRSLWEWVAATGILDSQLAQACHRSLCISLAR